MYYVLSRIRRLPSSIRRSKRVLIFAAIVLAVVAVLAYGYVISDRAVEPSLLKARQTVSLCVSDALSEYMSDNPQLSETLFGETSSAENGFAIRTDALASAEREIAEKLNSRLAAHSHIRVKIPSGSLSGIKYFSGKGLQIPFGSHLTFSVHTDPESSIESVGINHTLYRACIKLTVDCELVMSGKSESFSLEFEKILAERIIIGDVPLTN